MNILNHNKRKIQNINRFSRKPCFLATVLLYLNIQDKKSLPNG